MELLEWAVLPWMQRRERISGQGEAAGDGDAWPQRTGAQPGRGRAPQAGIRRCSHDAQSAVIHMKVRHIKLWSPPRSPLLGRLLVTPPEGRFNRLDGLFKRSCCAMPPHELTEQNRT